VFTVVTIPSAGPREEAPCCIVANPRQPLQRALSRTHPRVPQEHPSGAELRCRIFTSGSISREPMEVLRAQSSLMVLCAPRSVVRWMAQMRLVSMVVGFGLAARFAHAQASVEQLARCAAIPAAALRLQCYETLAKHKSDSSSRSPQRVRVGDRTIGNWIMSVEIDPISDQKGVTFALAAEGANPINTPTLIIRCKGGQLDTFVAPDEYLANEYSGLSESPEVTIRLGREPATQERRKASSDHTAAFYPGDRARMETFIRNLARYDRVAIQVTPYQKAPVAMVFRLAGIDQVNRELWAICPAPQQSDSEDSSGTGAEGADMVPTGNEVFMEAIVEEKPAVLSGPTLVFPELLRQAQISGRVLVQAIVDTLGRAEPPSVKVIQSPNPGFDQSAKNYVLKALFRPARVHGRAVRVLLQIPVDFKLRQ